MSRAEPLTGQAAEIAARSTVGPKVGLWMLATGHAVTDSYSQSLLWPMYPLIARQLGLDLAQVAGLTTVMGLSASLAQPLLGWLSDRFPRICMVALGPALAALMIGFLGVARDFATLAVIVFLAGIGIGAFHPQGAMLARQSGRGSGLAMSAFTVGGNIGYGLAPLLSGVYLKVFGLERFYFAALPAYVFCAAMIWVFRRVDCWESVRRPKTSSVDLTGQNWPALCALTGTVVVRTTVQVGMTTFLPFLVEQRFPREMWADVRGQAVSAFLLASAVAGPLGGMIADRFGRRRLMMWSFLLAPAPLLLGLQQSGYGLLALLAVGAFLLMLPHPINVVMAQEFMPRSAGIAASMITGLAAGLAVLFAWPLGAVAERTSIPDTLFWLSLLPVLGVVLVAPIPERAT